jgi:DNA-binding transcriptional ArsR family regulator
MDILEERAGEAAQLLKLLANETRLLILCRLVANGEMSVNAIVAAAGLGQSAVSQHLAKLRDDDLVTTRRDGQTIHYRIADQNVARVIAVLKDIYCRD